MQGARDTRHIIYTRIAAGQDIFYNINFENKLFKYFLSFVKLVRNHVKDFCICIEFSFEMKEKLLKLRSFSGDQLVQSPVSSD